jgi:predicted SprT family Zn-dependent metalloprotease
MQPTAAARLARRLLDENGLSDWSFRFDRSQRRFGCCRYRDSTITLSRSLTSLNEEERVRNTILHEIAHALAGPGAGHGPKWALQCRALGIPAQRCYDETDTVTPVLRYQATCEGCGRSFQRARRPTKRQWCAATAGCRSRKAALQWLDTMTQQAVSLPAGPQTRRSQGVFAIDFMAR